MARLRGSIKTNMESQINFLESMLKDYPDNIEVLRGTIKAAIESCKKIIEETTGKPYKK